MMVLRSTWDFQLGEGVGGKARTSAGWLVLLCNLPTIVQARVYSYVCRPSKGKGSRTKPIPEDISRKIGEANLHYANSRFIVLQIFTQHLSLLS